MSQGETEQPTNAPSDEELLKQVEEQLLNLKVSDLLVQTLYTVSSLGYRKLSQEDRDLDQAKLAIEALRALLPVLEDVVSADVVRDFRQVTANLQLAFADAALARLSELKGLGVHLSIDDFGTGFSSLSRLRRFPVDALKIDRVFIATMNDDRDSFEIVRLIITLAHSMGLQVVAEGTETIEQITQLKKLGCEMAQGFLYSRPVPAEQALDLLARDYGTPKELAAAAHAGG